MPDLNGLGPIQFSIEGTFTDKPRLLMDGQEVPYDSISMMYMPEEKFDYTDEYGNKKEEVLPEYISLSFSLTGKIGQLEANVSYRVNANEAGNFVVAKTEDLVHAAKPDFLKKKKDEKDSPKEDKKDKKKDGKPDFKKFKKGKSDVQADPNTKVYRRELYHGIIENLVVEDEE